MPEHKDTIAAILGASAALAGLLLIFMGFVYARGETYSTRRGDKFRITAKIGIVPFVLSLACTWMSTEWMLWHTDAFYLWTVRGFEASTVLTALYGTLVVIVFL